MPAKVKSNKPKKEVFFWPETVLYNGEEVYVFKKEVNFASYMMGKNSMNRMIYVTRPQVKKWLKDQGFND